MDQVFLEAAKSVPALVVLCWVVWTFVRSQHRQTDAVDRIAERFDKRTEEGHKIQMRALDSIDRNSQALASLQETVRGLK